MSTKQAFILRIAHTKVDEISACIKGNYITIGWARVRGLLNKNLDWEPFRELVHNTYYADEETYRQAGRAGGHLWRFINEMSIGDYVVVPYGSDFYVCEIRDEEAKYDEAFIDEDTAYRRHVTWLNQGKPIPRRHAKTALISRMKTYGTTANASDLVSEIEICLEAAKKGVVPTFASDLERRLVNVTLDEIRNGRIENYAFERLIGFIMTKIGAVDVKIVSRKLDKGVDIYAMFRLAGIFDQFVAIQAKHWQDESPVEEDTVQQLITGIRHAEEKEIPDGVTMGIVITSGDVGQSAEEAAKVFMEETGVPIRFMDGEMLAKTIVENGILPQELRLYPIESEEGDL